MSGITKVASRERETNRERQKERKAETDAFPSCPAEYIFLIERTRRTECAFLRETNRVPMKHAFIYGLFDRSRRFPRKRFLITRNPSRNRILLKRKRTM